MKVQKGSKAIEMKELKGKYPLGLQQPFFHGVYNLPKKDGGSSGY